MAIPHRASSRSPFEASSGAKPKWGRPAARRHPAPCPLLEPSLGTVLGGATRWANTFAAAMPRRPSQGSLEAVLGAAR
eukprot:199679-Pyramimonas_sp.AAC.1